MNLRRVAGAGAIVWGADIVGEGRRVIARAVIGLPGQAHAQIAETYGCRKGLKMPADTQCRLRAARIAGGNLNVVRYCGSEGRLKRPQIQDLLDGPLGDIAARGWALSWTAIRRRLDGAADVATTEGVFLAATLADKGSYETQVCVTRYDR